MVPNPVTVRTVILGCEYSHWNYDGNTYPFTTDGYYHLLACFILQTKKETI